MTVELNEKALSALDRLAEQIGSSRDCLVEQATETEIAQINWLPERINAGLAAADGGDFASDAEVRRVRTKFAQSP